MRLYLSSFRLGNQPDRLREMAGTAKRAAVILNACDGLGEAARKLRLDQEIAALEELGFTAEEMDLRRHTGAGADLATTLSRYGLVWVRGGNSFVLRRIMRASGFDGAIRKLTDDDALVYGGFSAAGAVAAPSLRGAELVDDPGDVPAGYPAAIVWEGLGLLPVAFVPHHRSGHPESPLIDGYVDHLIEHHRPFIALRDGQVLTVEGRELTVLS